MPSISPAQVRDFYRAAARFDRSAPWRAVDESETIQVECEPLEGGPWYALIMGQRGTVRGLMLLDDWKSRLLMQHGEPGKITEHLRGMTVHYEERNKIHPEALEMAKRHGFEVAGPAAYPSVVHMEPGPHYRRPEPEELDLLEACLWVIPDFVERAEDRRREILVYNFQGTTGPLTFDLSWVPMSRLPIGRP